MCDSFQTASACDSKFYQLIHIVTDEHLWSHCLDVLYLGSAASCHGFPQVAPTMFVPSSPDSCLVNIAAQATWFNRP